MIILELCCGWKSVSRVFAQAGGWSVTTLDILPKFRPDILADITEWDYESYFENHPIPDVIWASPPCRTFTVQAWGKYRDSNGGASNLAGQEGDACVRACLECISFCLRKNPKLSYFVENPAHGAFRHLDCVVPFIRAGNYRRMQYGDYTPDTHSLKPTLVLTNCDTWVPRQMLLVRSKRPWNTLSKKQRTVIPRAVGEEVLAAVVARMGGGRVTRTGDGTLNVA